ncbi:hypothetical protein GALL_523180 [mine drainage metagenome]|uniref:Uncharacterized protein n=1 Tax=mine drainage metagenome TaxID=410659 RepID=A0A1J5PRA8_9ZZZZ
MRVVSWCSISCRMAIKKRRLVMVAASSGQPLKSRQASSSQCLSAPCLVRVKTSARSTGSCFKSCASKAGLAEWSTWMMRWVMRSTVEATGVTATRAGSRSIASASSAISLGIVAEKNSVCRLIGSLATILRMSLMKPMSNMRSASSRTRNSTCPSFSPLLCTRSSRRPGVATMTSMPCMTARTWRPIGTPPIASAEVRRIWRP